MRNFSFFFPFHFKLRLLLLVVTIGICSQHSYAQCWEEITIPGYEDYHFRDVQFADSLHGWIFGTGVVLKTSDGGETWTKPRDFEGRIDNHSGYILNKDTLWVWGNADTLFYSHDGGDSWDFYKAGVGLGKSPIFFTNANKGWCTASDNIYHTKNGGRTWVLQQDLINESHRNIYMQDSLTGWAIGGHVYKTENGGETWMDLTDSLEPFGILLGIHCINKQNCWLGGVGANNEGATFYHTTDGGEAWTKISLNNRNIGIWDIYFTDSLVGWAVGNSGAILKTNNGGESWIKEISITEKNYRSIQFINQDIGWIVGGKNDTHAVLKYIAAPPQCISELYSPIPGDSTLASVWDTIGWKPSVGCVNGYRISLGYTENGTEILNDYDVGYDTVFIPSLPLPDDTTIYVTILAYGPSGESGDCTSFHFRTEETSGIEETIPGDVESMLLYPNPARDKVTLKLNLLKETSLKVEIYSVERVKIFEKETRTAKAGWNEIPFNISGIEEGLYFIRLETENGSIIRKLSVF